MATLAERTKQFIVQRLACFDSPSQIATALREEFGLTIDRRQIHDYDPEHRDVADKWRTLHEQTRAAFLAEAATVGIAHKAFRLRELERMYRRAADGTRPNVVLAASLLEQAAKEAGDAYSNKRGGAGGVSIEDLIRESDAEPVEHRVTVRFVRPGSIGGAGGPPASDVP